MELIHTCYRIGDIRTKTRSGATTPVGPGFSDQLQSFLGETAGPILPSRHTIGFRTCPADMYAISGPAGRWRRQGFAIASKAPPSRTVDLSTFGISPMDRPPGSV